MCARYTLTSLSPRERVALAARFCCIANGGLGAERDEVDICQLGASSQKPTLFIHSQLPALNHELRKPDGITRKFKCPGLSKHHVHGNVRGDSKAHTAFHPRLAGILATGVFHSF